MPSIPHAPLAFVAAIHLIGAIPALAQEPAVKPAPIERIALTDAQWRKILSGPAYQVLRRGATEAAFANRYWRTHETGTYHCAGCALPLYASSTKFDSGTGWPSFWQPLAKSAVVEVRDADGERIEVRCARCDGHLGHVFDDADGNYEIPRTPTGRRYCMNSAALRLIKKGEASPKPPAHGEP
ncbi:MAG: peptide-methionine (R)-S-oxide reductase MsrB [Armatimonadota bacterium]